MYESLRTLTQKFTEARRRREDSQTPPEASVAGAAPTASGVRKAPSLEGKFIDTAKSARVKDALKFLQKAITALYSCHFGQCASGNAGNGLHLSCQTGSYTQTPHTLR